MGRHRLGSHDDAHVIARWDDAVRRHHLQERPGALHEERHRAIAVVGCEERRRRTLGLCGHAAGVCESTPPTHNRAHRHRELRTRWESAMGSPLAEVNGTRRSATTGG